MQQPKGRQPRCHLEKLQKIPELSRIAYRLQFEVAHFSVSGHHVPVSFPSEGGLLCAVFCPCCRCSAWPFPRALAPDQRQGPRPNPREPGALQEAPPPKPQNSPISSSANRFVSAIWRYFRFRQRRCTMPTALSRSKKGCGPEQSRSLRLGLSLEVNLPGSANRVLRSRRIANPECLISVMAHRPRKARMSSWPSTELRMSTT